MWQAAQLKSRLISRLRFKSRGLKVEVTQQRATEGVDVDRASVCRAGSAVHRRAGAGAAGGAAAAAAGARPSGRPRCRRQEGQTEGRQEGRSQLLGRRDPPARFRTKLRALTALTNIMGRSIGSQLQSGLCC